MGANVLIAHHIGQKNDVAIKQAISTSMVVAVLSGVLVMFVGIALARPILEMMDTPHDVIDLDPYRLGLCRAHFLGRCAARVNLHGTGG